MKQQHPLKKFFSPTAFSLYLIVLMSSVLALKYFGIITYSVSKSPQKPAVRTFRSDISGVSTSSSVLKGLSPTPTSTPPVQKPTQNTSGEKTVSCVIDFNCGGGETILPLSVCENSACCFENGRYVQYWDRKSCGEAIQEVQNTPGPVINNYTYPIYIEETNNQPVRNYDPLTINSIGLTYSCLDTRHAEILLAEQDYLKAVDEIAQICARNDTAIYVDCVNHCSSENYEECEKTCYSQIDWKCSVNMTDSPEYRDLEHLLYMYCK